MGLSSKKLMAYTEPAHIILPAKIVKNRLHSSYNSAKCMIQDSIKEVVNTALTVGHQSATEYLTSLTAHYITPSSWSTENKHRDSVRTIPS